MRKPLFFTFKFSSLTVALIIGLIGVLNFSIAASAPTKSVSEWLFGQSASRLSSGVAKTCADETRSDDVTVADCIARRSNQLLRNSTLSLGENLVETNGSTLFGEDFKLKSQLSWGDGSGVQGELDAVIPVWSAAQTKSLFIQPGIAIWPGLGKQKRKRTDANLGLVYRSLNVGGDTLFGGSIFYDRNLDHDNQRLALGFDVQTKLGYASLNYYHPLSNDWRQGRSGFEERALRGYDFSLEKLFYQGRIDVDVNFGAWRRNQPSKWVYTYGVDLGYKVNNYLSLNLGYEDFSGQPLSGLPSNQRWQIGLKLDLMKLYAPKPAQNTGNQSPLDLWRTVTREKRILYQERVANTITPSAPTVTSIVYHTPASSNGTTNSNTVSWLITFSKPVQNVDVSDFVINAGGSSTGTTILSVTLQNNNTEALVTAHSNNEGTLRLSFSSLNDIADEHGNQLNTIPTSNANYHTFIIDSTAKQVITLTGPSTISFAVGGTYIEAGARVTDNGGGDITITIGGDTVDPNTVGTYIVTYQAADSAGTVVYELVRVVNITAAPTTPDTTKPVITLTGLATVSLEFGGSYIEAGATANDNVDGDITTDIVINSTNIDANAGGTYSVSYNLVDRAGNAADEVIRTVNVTVDVIEPMIALNGPPTINFAAGGTYIETGAWVMDNGGGDITITISGDTVDPNTVGTYIVTYQAADSGGNVLYELVRVITITAAPTTPDTTKPVITLLGEASISFEVGGSYIELGTRAGDNIDGDISANIVISGSVDASTVGTYTLTYKVSDDAGNAADTVTRTITVVDTTLPVIALNGPPTISFAVGGTYIEAGARVTDNGGGDITITIGGDTVDPNTVGTYIVTYNVVDSAGNAADTVTRTVNVTAAPTTADTTKPVITLNGLATVSLEVGSSYTDANATANDNVEGDISANIVISGSVDVNTVGIYTLSYNVSDSNSNAALTVTRTVTVVDTTLPVITLNGPPTISFAVGGTYIEAGARVTDNGGGDITITIGGDTVDPNTVGTYIVTYQAVDSAGNVVYELVRVVTITAAPTTPDTTKPVITLNGLATVSLEVGSSYTDANATANDNVEGDISANIVISGSVDVNTVGIYTLSYNVSDSNSNAALTVTRTVTVVDATLPVIALNGPPTIIFAVGGTYIEAGARVTDNGGGDITITIGGDTVDPNTVGTYIVTYQAVDSADNVVHELVRVVTITAAPTTPDTTKPVITLNGLATVSLEVGSSYTDASATANDNVEGDISANIVISGSVDVNTIGIYTRSYNVSDNAGNAADEVTRVVTVTAPPTEPAAITNLTAVADDREVTLNWTAPDDGGSPLTDYNLLIVPVGEALFERTPSGAATTYTVTGLTNGTAYTFFLTARNAVGDSPVVIVGATLVGPDTTKPVITLNGLASISLQVGSSYIDAGATANDNVDGDISGDIVIDSTSVNSNTVGIYSVTYNVVDSNSNAALTVTRTVTVVDTTLPVITLNGPPTISFAVGGTYIEAGARVTDNGGGDITITIGGDTVDPNTVGTYIVTYQAADSADNVVHELVRVVTITAAPTTPDTTKPVITLNGFATVSLEVDGSYIDAGATANDNVDGDISGDIVIDSTSVNSNTVGIYSVTYNVVDSNSNAALTVTRTVTVVDTTLPVITLNGPPTISFAVGGTYIEAGARVTDNGGGDITITIGGDTVDPNTVGTYIVTYQAADSADNVVHELVRVVTITAAPTTPDTTKPVITLNGLATVSLEVGGSYIDAGATANDNVDGDISGDIVISGSVDVNTIGIYTRSYNVSDNAGNAADEVTRVVTVTAPPTEPAAITNLTAVADDREVTLNWTAPDDGGSPLTDYNLLIVPVGEALFERTPSGAATTYTVTGLTNGTAYTFFLTARNAVGDSPVVIVGATPVGPDTTKPVITLNGLTSISLQVGSSYIDAGATANDNVDGDISGDIVIDSTSVNSNTVGIYSVTYNVVDSNSNAALTVTRTVTVVDTTLPVITLNGPPTISFAVGGTYIEAGARVTDNGGGDITITIGGDTVDPNTVGTYIVTYQAADSADNVVHELVRVVTITAAPTTPDTTKPVITLNGFATVSLEVDGSYIDAGATANDNVDGDISGDIVIDSTSVNSNTVGIYSVTYNVVDSNSNAALTVTRTVTVVDTTLPVITLNGPPTISFAVGGTYIEAGARVTDNGGGDITITIGGDTVDPNTVGTYIVTYQAVDSAGNVVHELVRVVTITAAPTTPDTTKPVITLNGFATVSLEVGGSYIDAGATANDNVDGDISGDIVIDSTSVNSNTVGIYSVTYNVVDSNSNAALTVTRTVTVVDATLPVITLNGPPTISFAVGGTYIEAGARVTDNGGGDITITIGGDTVDPNTVGTYIVTYQAVDSADNVVHELVRVVTITAAPTTPDTTKPVITLNGFATVSLEVGGSYIDAGATANDNVDGDISGDIVIDSTSVNSNTVGIYSVTYNVVDSNSNAALTVTRTVTIVDTTLPVITLNGPPTISFAVGGTYIEAGARVTDNGGGDITITIGGDTVDPNTVGTYIVTYQAVDSAGNVVHELVRVVTITAAPTTPDTTKPVITLNGFATVSLEVDGSYIDAGATANDNVDGDISGDIVIDSTSVNSNTVGIYSVTYNVVDSNSNAALTVTRTVTVVDTTLPMIALNGLANVSLEFGSSYTEHGARASDNVDGDISGNIVISGSVDVSTVGLYTLSYNLVDSNSNAALTVTRTVTVVDTTLPVIALNGLATVSLEVGDIYTEAGAMASDNVDGGISGNIVISGSVDANTVGIYTLSYKVSDSNSNAALTVTRTVTVVDTTLPVITLTGLATVSLEVGDSYTEASATASDNVDGDISGNIVISGSVDASTVGIYTLSYNIVDSNSNAALTVTRTVTVVDTTLPMIALNGLANVSLEFGGSYTEAGARASDNVDGDISDNIMISGSVDASTVGIYTLSYNVVDNNSNEALTVTRTVTVVDTTLPVITLNGLATVSLEVGGSYTEAGAMASDNVDGGISGDIVIDSTSVNSNTVGIYSVTYNVVDSNSNEALTVTRTVTVVDTTLPVITLNGSATFSLEVGSNYSEAGATASDNVDGDISANIKVSGSVDTSTVGIYTLSYNLVDSNSNAALTLTRTVTVVNTTLPVITLTGSATVSLEVGEIYTEAGATASDNLGTVISANIMISGSVDINTVGSYTLSYDVVDDAGNVADTVTRTVTVVDTTLPVITLNGPATVSLEVGSSYTELNASASDNVGEDITANIVISGSVDASTVGIYTLSYDVVDDAGNAADTVTRTVTVVDNTLPVITLNGLTTVSLEVGDSYTEADARASDNVDGDISGNIVISGSVDANTVGIYSLSYNVVDDAGNVADTVTRTVTVVDTTLPVITLNGRASVSLEVGSSYTELNATASDNVDGGISGNIVISGSVDASTVGIYTLSYNASDSNSNAALTVTRTVTVVDTTLPVITLNGPASVSLEVGSSYTEADATASDNVDGDITANIVISGSVDASTVGIYTLSYNASDSNSNAALTVTRTVAVVDITLPVISLTGPAIVSLEVGSSYTEQGAGASDNVDGEISANIVISGSVDVSTVGIYTLIYNLVDNAGNAADTVTRTVIVVDTTLPVITLNGLTTVSLEVGSSYTELGATANDNVDGGISGNIVISASVDASTVGIYTLSYNVVDDAGNAADTVTRTVTVVDTTLPVITLTGPATVNLEAGYLYIEAGATATDNIDGEITTDIVIDSTNVDANTVGTYSVTYNVVDRAGNAADTVTRTVNVTVDVTPPTIIIEGIASDLNGSPFTATITFSEAVTGFEQSDITVSNNLTLTNFSGAGSTYTVSVTATANGLFSLSLAAGIAEDATGNPNTVTVLITGTADITAPEVVSIERASPTDAVTNIDSVSWRITFNETVMHADASDFILSGSTARLTVRAESGAVRVVSASGGDIADLDGQIRLDFAPAYTIEDRVGNPLTDTTPSSGTNDSTFTLDNTDHTAPEVVSIQRLMPTVATTNANILIWSILFNEGIRNPNASDFILIGGSTGILAVAPISKLEVYVFASGNDLADFNGDVTLGFADRHDIQDEVGNPLTNTTPTGTNGSTFTLDNIVPEVVSIERASPTDEFTNTDDRVSWHVTFSEAVSNADANDFSLNGTTATLAVTVESSASAVLVLTASGGDIADLTGQIRLGFAPAYTIEDRGGNPLTDTTPSSGTNDSTFTLGNTAPEVVSIRRLTPTVAITNADNLTWSILFNEEIKTPDASDFIFISGRTAFLTVAIRSKLEVHVSASGNDLTDFNGDITLGFADTHNIQDRYGNRLTNTTPTGTNDNTFTLDNTAPEVVSIRRGLSLTAALTNADTLGWGILFSEPIKNLDASDFILSGGSRAILTLVHAGELSTGRFGIHVTASGGDLSDFNGDVTLGFADTHGIQDAVGNPLTTTTPSGTNESTYTLDNIAPTVTIEDVPEYINNLTPFTATIRFSKVVDGFERDDITVSNATLGAINGSGTTYRVLVTPTAPGIISLQVAAGVAEDAAGNQNSASTEAIGTVPDTTPPEITLNGPNPYHILRLITYVEHGATATDNIDGDISDDIVIDHINVTEPGSHFTFYKFAYNVSDSASNAAATVTRTVRTTFYP